MMENKKTIARVAILIASCLMGTVGIFVDLLGQFNVISITLFRSLFGLLFLTFFILGKKELKNLKILTQKPHWLILLGTSNGFTVLFYFFTSFSQL